MIRLLLLSIGLFFSSAALAFTPAVTQYCAGANCSIRGAAAACSAYVQENSVCGYKCLFTNPVVQGDSCTFSLLDQSSGISKTGFGLAISKNLVCLDGSTPNAQGMCPDSKCQGSPGNDVPAYGGANTLIVIPFKKGQTNVSNHVCDKNGCSVFQVSGGGGANADGTKYGMYGKFQMEGPCSAVTNTSDQATASTTVQQKSADKTKDPVACSAKGGFWGQVNGVDACIPSDGAGNGTSNKTDTKSTTATNADGSSSKTTQQTSVTCSDGKCTTTTTTTTQNYDSSGNAVGSAQTSSTSTTSPDKGGGAATDGGPAKGNGSSTTGPDSAQSTPVPAQSAPTPSGSGPALPDAPSDADLYKKKSDKASDKWDAFSGAISNAPLITSAKSFFTLGGISGVCPSWSYPIDYLKTTVTFDAFCKPEVQSVMSLVGPVLMALAAWAAFKIAVM